MRAACATATGGTASLPLAAQVIAAVSSASYAATLIIVASLLTRKRAWVRQTQIGTLGTAIALAAISVAVGAIVGNGVDATGLVVTLIFVLLDALAIVIMTERRVVSWYDQTATIPVYVWATLGALDRRQRHDHRPGRAGALTLAAASDVGQEVLDDLHELVVAHRFHHHRRGAELLRTLAGADVPGSGEDDHPGARVLGREADRLEELQPVGVEGRVQDEHVGLERGELVAHLAHRLRPAHLVAEHVNRLMTC